MSELKSSRVHRNLDAKLKIMGMEAYDLLFVLIFTSIMNILFGKTSLALYLVFLLPSVMTLVLFFSKRNKPENFLIHLVRYHLSPGFFSAGKSAVDEHRMNGRITE